MTPPVRRDIELFQHAPWRQLQPRALQTVTQVPTMLHPEEQKLYFWLAAIWARDAGAIVDLGCFVGGSTARLAAGAAAAGLKAPIHAYDRFTADDNVKARALYSAGVAPFDGHDILPLTQEFLSPWSGRITLHPGEIEDQGWSGDPIEVLVVDAAKTASTADAIASTFFPALIPGRSVVVQQDCLHWRLPWLPAQMDALKSCFTPVARSGATSVVFLCTHKPDRRALVYARVGALEDDELIARLGAARHALAPFDDGGSIDRMKAAIRANPGERVSWRLSKP